MAKQGEVNQLEGEQLLSSLQSKVIPNVHLDMESRNSFPYKVSIIIGPCLWLFSQDVLQGIFCISKCQAINL